MQPDATCSVQSVNPGFPDQGLAYHCTGSELGHLFNAATPDGLGNPNEEDDACFAGAGLTTLAPHSCFQNGVSNNPFTNAYAYLYWSSTEYALSTTSAWFLSTNNGFQGGDSKDDGLYFYVWPVRDNPPTPVPTMSIWGLAVLVGLLGLIGFRRRMK